MKLLITPHVACLLEYFGECRCAKSSQLDAMLVV